jgi:hypothetical protein
MDGSLGELQVALRALLLPSWSSENKVVSLPTHSQLFQVAVLELTYHCFKTAAAL